LKGHKTHRLCRHGQEAAIGVRRQVDGDGDGGRRTYRLHKHGQEKVRGARQIKKTHSSQTMPAWPRRGEGSKEAHRHGTQLTYYAGMAKRSSVEQGGRLRGHTTDRLGRHGQEEVS
jgi:hypothetical protein